MLIDVSQGAQNVPPVFYGKRCWLFLNGGLNDSVKRNCQLTFVRTVEALSVVVDFRFDWKSFLSLAFINLAEVITNLRDRKSVV